MWTTKDATRLYGRALTEAHAAQFISYANATLKECQAAGGKGCAEWAVRVAKVRLQEGIETPANVGEALTESTIDEFWGLMEADGTTQVTLDEKNMVLRNVKFCGTISRNGREYTDRSLNSMVRLAENKLVYVDHPADVKKNRSVRDLGGCSRGLHRAPDGVRGDWHYHKRVEEDIKAALKHRLSHVGHSLNGRGRLRRGNGASSVIVEDYLVHNSFDFVVNPATVTSLAESVDPDITGAGGTKGIPMDETKELREALDKVTKSQEETHKLVSTLTEQLAEEKKARIEAEDALETQKKATVHSLLIEEAIKASGKTVPEGLLPAMNLLETRAQMDTFLGALTETGGQPATPLASKALNTGTTTPIGAGGADDAKKKDDALTEEIKGIFSTDDAPSGHRLMGTRS